MIAALVAFAINNALLIKELSTAESRVGTCIAQEQQWEQINERWKQINAKWEAADAQNRDAIAKLEAELEREK